jgi:hypothetical protein
MGKGQGQERVKKSCSSAHGSENVGWGLLPSQRSLGEFAADEHAESHSLFIDGLCSFRRAIRTGRNYRSVVYRAGSRHGFGNARFSNAEICSGARPLAFRPTLQG